jgi:GntR family transcriptional regulator, transcriptional repressor for pyruvate dehydrogenase complex
MERMIRERRMEPGERLGTKEQLRGGFGVAVATFNEALRMLESRGVVDLRPGPGGGVFVAAPPALVRLGHKMLALDGESASVAGGLAVRDALEPLVALEALTHHTAADIVELRRLAVEMAGCADAADYLRVNWALHRRLVRISPNPLLVEIYLGLLDLAEEHLRGVRVEPGMSIMDGVAVHAALVEAIGARDRSALAAAVRDHARLTSDQPPLLG